MVRKENRNLKVYEKYGYGSKSTPMILLQGQWLKELGFDASTPITVKCEDGKLTITPRELEKEERITLIVKNGVTKVAEKTVVYG